MKHYLSYVRTIEADSLKLFDAGPRVQNPI